jgi:hypothetical protein
MSRKHVIAFAVAIAACAGVALLLGFWLSSGRPGGDPTSALRSEPTADSGRPGIRTLDQLAAVVNSGDPAAPGRVRAVAQAIAEGRASADEIDGVPFSATVIPAWWMEGVNLFEVRVMLLGHKDKKYQILLANNSGVIKDLSKNVFHSHSFHLSEGPWVHSYEYYVDERWEPVNPPAHAGVVSFLDEQGAQRYAQLERSVVPWTLSVGDQRIPLVVGQRPVPVPGDAPVTSN